MTPRNPPTSPPHPAAARAVPTRQPQAPAQRPRPSAGGAGKGRTPGAGSTSPRDAAGSRTLPALNAPMGGRKHVVCTTRHWRPGAPSAAPPAHAASTVETNRAAPPVRSEPVAPAPAVIEELEATSPERPPQSPTIAAPRPFSPLRRPAHQLPPAPPAPAPRTAAVPPPDPEPDPKTQSTPRAAPRATLGPIVAAGVLARSELVGRWSRLVRASVLHADRVVEALDRARVDRLRRRLQRDRARHARLSAPADPAPLPFPAVDAEPHAAPAGAEPRRFLGVFSRTAPPAWRLMLVGALGCLLIAAAVIIARNELAKSRIAPTPRVFNPRRAELLRRITLDRAELIRRTILAFHATHGRLPRDLTELVPEFLPGVPKPVNGALDWSYRALPEPAPARAGGAPAEPAFDLSFRSWRDPLLKHEQVDQDGRWTLAE